MLGGMDASEICDRAAHETRARKPSISSGKAAWRAGVHASAAVAVSQIMSVWMPRNDWPFLIAPVLIAGLAWGFYQMMWRDYHAEFRQHIDRLRGDLDV